MSETARISAGIYSLVTFALAVVYFREGRKRVGYAWLATSIVGAGVWLSKFFITQ